MLDGIYDSQNFRDAHFNADSEGGMPQCDPDLLYILSPSFSGSTLLTFLLAAHPEIATVGELKASAMGDVNTYRCSCGDRLMECAFWQEVRKELRSRGIEFSFANFGTNFNCGPAFFRRLVRLGSRAPVLSRSSSFLLRASPSCRTHLKAIIAQNRVLISVITALQNARVFLDGSKDPERLHQLLISRRWRIKVIHLIRDGRGTTNSYMKHYGVDMKSASTNWLRTARDCGRIAAKLPKETVLNVKYEELCNEPEVIVNRILLFAGFTTELPPTSRVSLQMHILGNAMRLEFNRSIKIDEKWKKQLVAKELKIFDRIAGNYNRNREYY